MFYFIVALTVKLIVKAFESNSNNYNMSNDEKLLFVLSNENMMK